MEPISRRETMRQRAGGYRAARVLRLYLNCSVRYWGPLDVTEGSVRSSGPYGFREAIGRRAGGYLAARVLVKP